ncbi:DUF202 domain-containing protein [Kineococcus rhizosphaerae]|uniref:Uncharacterized protein DUF202 n=1 Tax=Kineococcus rhizosphaerae TaxID=559628 RepID=A0A2T0RB38_9ACTN|nr:DUF202 domain-containing protein [Kineococcus rhizosphaerae]PRY18384.1 uncharacterized protein DUF202 [Kineococcus rhizosphaerae]
MSRFDPGLQPERTALAWRRTAVSVLVGSAAGGRLLAGQLGAGAVVLGIAGCAFAVWLHAAAGARARRTSRALARDGHLGRGPDGRVLALTCAFSVLVGAFAVSVVLGHGLSGILTSR